jgi:hypothetical protein
MTHSMRYTGQGTQRQWGNLQSLNRYLPQQTMRAQEGWVWHHHTFQGLHEYVEYACHIPSCWLLFAPMDAAMTM